MDRIQYRDRKIARIMAKSLLQRKQAQKRRGNSIER